MDPLEQQNVADAPGNQALVKLLQENLLSRVERSYRPWRDTSYLEALSGPNFSPDLEALKSTPLPPGGKLIVPLGPGAAQILFAPNEAPLQSNAKATVEELLGSLPYDEP
jgi:hypothetical protein